MQRLTTRLDTKAEELIDHWGRLALLNPEFGAVSADDRSSARNSAVTVKADLNYIRGISVEILRTADRMRLEPKVLGEPLQFSKNCRDFYRSGRNFAS